MTHCHEHDSPLPAIESALADMHVQRKVVNATLAILEPQIRRRKVEKALLQTLVDASKKLDDDAATVEAGIPAALANATAAQDAVENPLGQQIAANLTAAQTHMDAAKALVTPAA